MLQIASLIVINLLIAAFIGFLIGLIVGKKINTTTNKTTTKKEEPSKKPIVNEPTEEGSKDGKPFVLTSPQGDQKDNLRKIKGIDNTIEKELNALGIFHFKQIALWNKENCEWIEEHLNLSGLISELKWIEQAKILQTGKETLFSQNIK